MEEADGVTEETSTEPAEEDGQLDREEALPSDSSSGRESDATPREEAALGRARKASRLLDEAVRVPGTDFRVGIDPILGILPGAGDAVAAAISLYPVVEAYRLDAPRETMALLLALVAIDAVVGSVPVLGPVFDAVWKANEWNVDTLEDHVHGD